VEVLPPSGPVAAGVEVEVKVRVTNLTGHKLPTGYGDGRRVFIELSVGDQVVSGRYDAAAGVLVADPQLAVFEAVHGRADGGLDHLALHDTIFKDTRIEPLGFQPDDDTRPVGISFLKASDGSALGAVEWTYRVTFPAELAGDAGVVTARLFHQATTRDYVEALAQANATDSTGTQLLSIWNATGQAAPVEMASVSRSVPLVTLDEAGVSGSCGCHATSGSAAVFPALAALVLLALRTRRVE
jgi:MYXO-CTERM domain-containing protein